MNEHWSCSWYANKWEVLSTIKWLSALTEEELDELLMEQAEAY